MYGGHRSSRLEPGRAGGKNACSRRNLYQWRYRHQLLLCCQSGPKTAIRIVDGLPFELTQRLEEADGATGLFSTE